MKESCKDKQKEDNKAGNNGETLRCIPCDSKKHLLQHCPHLWENMVNFVESDSSSEDSLFSMASKEQKSDKMIVWRLTQQQTTLSLRLYILDPKA